MSFRDKVVIVTGGGSGIGATTAILFAKEGANIAIVDRNTSKLKEIDEEITKFGKRPLVIIADLSKEEETRTVVKRTIEKFGKLDVLVNCAGIIRYVSVFDENLLQAYDEVMNINLRPIVLLTNLAAPYLVKTKGNIVNVSSIAGLSTLNNFGSGYIPYCTSKAGINHFSRVAAVELAEKGVRVNVVNPGPVKTNFVENAGVKVDWEDAIHSTALKRLIQPDEVADLILYLASDKAKSITGVCHVIDSGSMLI